MDDAARKFELFCNEWGPRASLDLRRFLSDAGEMVEAVRAETREPLESRLEAYETAVTAMFNQEGCDCDSAWLTEVGYDGGGWAAYDHASDCPVQDRWGPFERRLRASVGESEGEE